VSAFSILIVFTSVIPLTASYRQIVPTLGGPASYVPDAAISTVSPKRSSHSGIDGSLRHLASLLAPQLRLKAAETTTEQGAGQANPERDCNTV